MNNNLTTYAAAGAIEREWRRLAFTESAPANFPPVLDTADQRINRAIRCGACGPRSQAAQTLHRGEDYGLLYRCRKCGAGKEV